jgi:hypothetical protein
MQDEEYHYVYVESFIPEDLSGRHGPVHIRPLPNQPPVEPDLFVSCSKMLSEDYPVGTKFRIKAKFVQNPTDTVPYIYSHYSWPYTVINDQD